METISPDRVAGPSTTLVAAATDLPPARRISGTGRAVRLLAMAPTAPSAGSGRDLVVTGTIVALSGNEPDLDNVETISIDVSEAPVAGRATHRGQTIIAHPGGERSFVAYEGSWQATSRQGGRPHTAFEGEWWYTGGTGRFAGIVGGGTYAGYGTASGLSYVFDGEYRLRAWPLASRVPRCA